MIKLLHEYGADLNFMNNADDLTLFWAIDGGVEMIKLLHEYGADLDARNAKDWTPLSYARAAGKYGLAFEKGIYPEDVLLYYGAKLQPGGAQLQPREGQLPEAAGAPLRERKVVALGSWVIRVAAGAPRGGRAAGPGGSALPPGVPERDRRVGRPARI